MLLSLLLSSAFSAHLSLLSASSEDGSDAGVSCELLLLLLMLWLLLLVSLLFLLMMLLLLS